MTTLTAVPTSTTTAPSTPTPRTGRPGIPFARLLRVEARKLVDTRSGRGLLVAIAVITLLAVGAQVWFGDRGTLSLESLLAATAMPQMLLIPVFGIIAMTSEFSQRTAMTTFALEPRRGRVVLAKVLAALLFALGMLAVGVLGAVAAHLIAIGLKDEPAAWALPWQMGAGLVAGQALSVLQGLAFGLLLRSPALAIVVYFALPTVFTIATSLVSALADVRPWVDFGTATLTVFTGGVFGDAWGHLATSGALWLGIPFAVGVWLLRRREIV